jgi:hypothetical protein
MLIVAIKGFVAAGPFTAEATLPAAARGWNWDILWMSGHPVVHSTASPSAGTLWIHNQSATELERSDH